MDPVCIWEPEKCLEVDHLDKINFQDIQAEHINRYQLVPVPGTTDQFDIIPVRGTVTVEGTPVRALELNQLQENIEEGCLSVSGGSLTGPLTTQNIVPDTNGTRNIGNTSKRYATVYAGNGNFGGQLAAGSAMLSGALTTQDIVPDNNNSRNLGTDSKRYKSIKAFVGSFGEQITSPSGIFDNYLEVKGNEVWHPGNLKIATGESSIGDTGTGKSDTVTISLSSYGFVKRPVVFVSPNSTDLNTWAHVTQATATSFTVVGGRNSTNPGGFGFMWLAVQL